LYLADALVYPQVEAEWLGLPNAKYEKPSKKKKKKASQAQESAAAPEADSVVSEPVKVTEPTQEAPNKKKEEVKKSPALLAAEEISQKEAQSEEEKKVKAKMKKTQNELELIQVSDPLPSILFPLIIRTCSKLIDPGSTLRPWLRRRRKLSQVAQPKLTRCRLRSSIRHLVNSR